MLNPLLWFANYGLHLAGVLACGVVLYKTLPKVLPSSAYPQKKMRTLFLRTKLYIEVGMHKQKIYPELVRFKKEDWGYRFVYRLIPGITLQQLKDKKALINAAFNGESSISGQGNEVKIDIQTRSLPKEASFEISSYYPLLSNQAIPVVLGYSRKGLEMLDLAQVPHAMIGGDSGVGKSSFIRQCLTALIYLRAPEQLQLTLCDLKHGMELSMFKNLPHVAGFAKNSDELKDVMKQINQMINSRGRLFEEVGVTNIREYNRRYSPSLAYHLIVVDELAEMKEADTFERISRIGRSYGIHLLYATQKPNAKIFDSKIKANCPLTICLKVKDVENSLIILGNEKATKIKDIPGRAIIQYHKEYDVQTTFLAESEAKRLIQSRLQDFPEVLKRKESSSSYSYSEHYYS